MRIIACIEDPDVIEKIFAHLDAEGAEPCHFGAFKPIAF